MSPVLPVRHRWSLVGIILLGAFLRLYQLDLTDFGDHEAAGFNLALGWLDEGRLPLVGVSSSTGVDRPAGMSYLLAPFLLLSREPLIVTALLALVNVAAIPFCYRLVARYFGQREALLASLLYAGSFWAAYIARQAWDMAPMAPLALLVLDRLLAAAGHRRPAAWGWALFWAAFAVAVHPAALGLAGAVAVVALAFRPRPARAMLPGPILGVLSWVPFLWYLAGNQWRDLRQALQVGASPPTVDLDIVGLALWQLFPNPRDDLFQSPAGSILPGTLAFEGLHLLVVTGFLAALLSCAVRGMGAIRRRASPQAPYLVLALVCLTPIALLIRHPFPLFNHYAFPLLPYAAIILAVGLSRVLGPQSWVLSRFRLGKRDAGLRTQDPALWAALALVAVQAFALVWLMHWVGANGGTFWRGAALRFLVQGLDAAASARFSVEDPVTVAIGEHRQHYDYLVRDRFAAQVVNHNTTLVFPPGDRPAVYLTSVDEGQAARFLRVSFPETERFRLLRSSLPDHYRVFVLPPESGPLAQAAASQTKGPWSLDNGIRLEGYAVPEDAIPSQDLPLTLAWTVAATLPNPRADSRFFAHLFDRTGHKWAEANELDYGTARWRPGDRVISWLRVPVPAGAPRGIYSLGFGMFDPDSMERVPLTGAGGKADSLVARPLRVTPVGLPEPPSRVFDPPIRFGGTLDLLGYDLPPTAASGSQIVLRLIWQAARPSMEDFTLFAHLRDSRGQVIAQADGFPSQGLYPTSAWRRGETVEDERLLAVPFGMEGQGLTVALGWYLLATGQRLPLDGAGESALVLGPVLVAP